ncbi:MAG: SDR family NAD(P)-dependent oxidoreductase [Novosphingobium sp.]|nr:SDR family NAD(P)-dependent oxidoreductase [Novosphingobium sp.]
MSLEGTNAVVTGGGSGMGQSTCVQLARDGAALAVWDVNEAGAQETVALIEAEGNTAIAVQCDVSSKDSVTAATERTREELGPVTVLVNNAGISGPVPFLEIDEALWDRMMGINLKGPWHVTQAIIPDMIAAQWGRIVNVTSSSTQIGSPGMTHYSSSKGGLAIFTKSLAAEFARQGITANNVPPNFIDTPMLREHFGQDFIDDRAKSSMMGRPGTGEDIATAISYLCSREAKHINGHTLSVNGGNYMN